jgi:tripartite-type tricarboxylate transporter receptor subunit TctC
MKPTFRKLFTIVTVVTSCLVPLCATAQGAYPNKPIRIILGVAPGGLIDVSARLIGSQLSPRLGQPVIVDNRPGAATTIAANAVLNPDGHPNSPTYGHLKLPHLN